MFPFFFFFLQVGKIKRKKETCITSKGSKSCFLLTLNVVCQQSWRDTNVFEVILSFPSLKKMQVYFPPTLHPSHFPLAIDIKETVHTIFKGEKNQQYLFSKEYWDFRGYCWLCILTWDIINSVLALSTFHTTSTLSDMVFPKAPNTHNTAGSRWQAHGGPAHECHCAAEEWQLLFASCSIHGTMTNPPRLKDNVYTGVAMTCCETSAEG